MTPPSSHLRKLGVVVLVVLPCALWISWVWYARRPVHQLAGPKLIFWAWERPEDLRFLNPQGEGVAFLASSIELLPDGVHVFPRMQPLRIAPGTQLVAVVRIYTHPASPAALDAQQLQQALQTLVTASEKAQVTALQIDFDARESERTFYTQLLQLLRARMGPRYPISITALASWCIGDRWIHDLPVDEAVPMLFSMGKDEALIRQYLGTVGRFPEPLCRGSVGISTGEIWPGSFGSRTRVYVFSSSAWTQESAKELRSRLHRGI